MSRPRFWRWFANSATILNAFSGIWAIIYIVWGNKLFALALMFTAIGWDGLDGYAARRAGDGDSTFGRVADSVSDSITFCLAPGALVAIDLYPQSTWAPYGFVPLALGIAVAGIGIARLVRYTLSAHALPHFMGASTPQNAMAIMFLVLLFDVPGYLNVLPLPFLIVVAILAPLMLLPIPYPRMRDRAVTRLFLFPIMTTGVFAIAIPNLRPPPGTFPYFVGDAFALAGILLLGGFYVGGPLMVRHGIRKASQPPARTSLG